ncbi:hypothetical protein SGL43_04892 [Streptomyces globisporus]|uniref:Uncharacterized protein n=1 Tax=Streptomyces globisporus TaxID=1908 RepID=A0ABM9H2M0_STRGL|nr:hypothetical protein SGL43_04892 [Streptomyces globisporus]
MSHERVLSLARRSSGMRCRDHRRAVLGWYRAVQQTRPAAR